MEEEIKQTIVKLHCEKGNLEVTVIIGLTKDGETKFVKVLCPYYRTGFFGGPSCRVDLHECGIAKGAKHN